MTTIHRLLLCWTDLQSAPPKKNFVRGISYITGYHIVATNGNPDQPGCFMSYVTQADPKGKALCLIYLHHI